MGVDLALGSYLSRVKTTRAAVVPYVVLSSPQGDELYFLLARDRISGDITDLGGGVKQNEFDLGAALREFKEESNNIFNGLYDKVNELAINVALIGNGMSVLFIPLEKEWFYKATSVFQDKKKTTHPKKKSHNEVSELLWVDEEKFVSLIAPNNREMWGRLRKFYRNGYSEELTKALRILY